MLDVESQNQADWGERLTAPLSTSNSYYAVTMSWINTWLKFWRWPIVRRYCFLRLYFNTRTLAARSLSQDFSRDFGVLNQRGAQRQLFRCARQTHG